MRDRTRFIILLTGIWVAVLCLAATPVWAQSFSSGANTPIVPPLADPVIPPARPDGARCFSIRNAAPYTVMGSFRTNFYEAPDGTQVRAQTNFRLGPGDGDEYCTYGPFYDGGRLEITLRTIVPIFSCFTLAGGEITVRGEMKKGGGTRTWIDCR